MNLEEAVALIDENLWLYMDYGDVEEEFMDAWEVVKEHIETLVHIEHINNN